MRNVLGFIVGSTIIGLMALTLGPSPSEQTEDKQEVSEISATILQTSQEHHSQTVQKQTAAWYRYFDLKEDTEGIQSAPNLQIKPETQQTQKGFTIFRISNHSAQTQALKIQDGSLIMIQEALGPEGNWIPVEYWDYDWGFGSEFGELHLKPQHSVRITAPKFEGDFKTKFRLKLKINDTEDLLYSEEFEGMVSVAQFQKPVQAKKTMSYLK